MAKMIFPKTKTVALPNGFEFDTYDYAKWLAMDKDGSWHVHTSAWEPSRTADCWTRFYFAYKVNGLEGPFEPGDWTEQLYWIGD